MKALENENRNDEQQDRDDKKIEFATGLSGKRWAKIDILCAFDSVRRELEYPGQYKRNRQTADNEHNNQPDRPVRNVEDWENLCDALRERPTRDNVGRGDFVNVAPL